MSEAVAKVKCPNCQHEFFAGAKFAIVSPEGEPWRDTRGHPLLAFTMDEARLLAQSCDESAVIVELK